MYLKKQCKLWTKSHTNKCISTLQRTELWVCNNWICDSPELDWGPQQRLPEQVMFEPRPEEWIGIHWVKWWHVVGRFQVEASRLRKALWQEGESQVHGTRREVAWEMERWRGRRWDDAGFVGRALPLLGLCGLVDFILRAVDAPRGAGMLVIVSLYMFWSDLCLIIILASVWRTSKMVDWCRRGHEWTSQGLSQGDYGSFDMEMRVREVDELGTY